MHLEKITSNFKEVNQITKRCFVLRTYTVSFDAATWQPTPFLVKIIGRKLFYTLVNLKNI